MILMIAAVLAVFSGSGSSGSSKGGSNIIAFEKRYRFAAANLINT